MLAMTLVSVPQRGSAAASTRRLMIREGRALKNSTTQPQDLRKSVAPDLSRQGALGFTTETRRFPEQHRRNQIVLLGVLLASFAPWRLDLRISINR